MVQGVFELEVGVHENEVVHQLGRTRTPQVLDDLPFFRLREGQTVAVEACYEVIHGVGLGTQEVNDLLLESVAVCCHRLLGQFLVALGVVRNVLQPLLAGVVLAHSQAVHHGLSERGLRKAF